MVTAGVTCALAPLFNFRVKFEKIELMSVLLRTATAMGGALPPVAFAGGLGGRLEAPPAG